MKYLMIFVLVFFVGCGSSNNGLNLKDDKNISVSSDVNSSFDEEVDVFQEIKTIQKVIYDKESTKEKIKYFSELNSLGLPQDIIGEDESMILPTQNLFNELVDKLTKYGEENHDFTSLNIAIHLKVLNVDFEYESVVVLSYSASSIRHFQTFISLDNNHAMIEAKMLPKGEYLLPSAVGFVRVFLVSKDIQTINGYDNF